MASSPADSGLVFEGTSGAGTMWKVHSALTLVQTCYAVSNIFQKVSFTAGINPIAFSVYRDIASVFLLVPLALFIERGRRTPLDWTTLALIVFSGFLGMYASQLLLTFGISLAPASYGCLIGITTQIFVFLISVASGLEEIKWTRRQGQAKVLGAFSALCGAILIPIYNGPEIIRPLRDAHRVSLSELAVEARGEIPTALFNVNVEDWQLGGFLLILAGFTYAAYWTTQAYILKRYPYPVSTAALAYIVGALMLAVTGLLRIPDASEWAIHPTDVLSISYVGFIACGMNLALQSWALYKAGPVLLAGYAPVQPLTTIAIAWLVLGEGIHLGSVLGLLFIVNGLYLITWGQFTSRKEAIRPVKIMSNPMDGSLMIKGDSNLEQHLLG